MADDNRQTQSGVLDFTEKGSPGALEESGVDAAADAWAAVLADDDGEHHDDTATRSDKPKAKASADSGDSDDSTGEAPEAEIEEDPPQDGEPDDDAEDDNDQEDADPDDEDAEGDDEPPEELDPDTKIRVKVDGVEQDVTLEELRAGYSRRQDYTRKTQQLAQDRQLVEQQYYQVLQQQQDWSGLLNHLKTQIQAGVSGLSEAQWAELKATDEVAYYEAREKERQVRDRLQAIETEQQRVTQLTQQQQLRQQQHLVQEQQRLLLQEIPDWNDQKVFQEDLARIHSYGESMGFTPEEINGLVDHRAVRVLRDAMRYQALKTNRGKGNSKDKVRTRKAMKPGTRPTDSRTPAARQKRAMSRLRKEQTVDAAADFFQGVLDRDED